jgi:pimeloyl-ACP methyl ester carboxylesterase
MEGKRSSVAGADGVDIGLLTAGTGPSLLLVHGGVGQIERWGPVWPALTERWRVTAMDRRGRGSSGDARRYSIEVEFEDVASVASALAEQAGAPVDVFAHSYGATCTLGAVAGTPAPFRRVVFYEPPGPGSVSPEWVDRMTAMVAEGRPGRAMESFLKEIIGLSSQEVDDLKRAPVPYDILSVLSATLPREGTALLTVDLVAAATSVTRPTRLLLGERSPRWAGDITRMVAGAIPDSAVVLLPGVGHEAIDAAPDLVVSELEEFFVDGMDG